MSETVQVLKGTSATIRGQFYSGGVLTNVDTPPPTATITKPDGTAGPASGTVTSAGTGIYQFTLAATSTATPTIYTVTWAGSVGGQPQTLTTFVEVVGEFLFTLADARSWDGGAITSAIASDQAVLDKRVEITDDFGRICGVSFVPRFARETHSADGSDALVLRQQRATALLSVTVDGVAQSLANFTVTPAGVLRAVSGYRLGTPPIAGISNVVVEYIHGWDRPPPPVATAGLRVARSQLIPTNVGERATSIVNDAGTILLATAGRGEFQPYGLPLVDSVLARYLEPQAA